MENNGLARKEKALQAYKKADRACSKAERACSKVERAHDEARRIYDEARRAYDEAREFIAKHFHGKGTAGLTEEELISLSLLLENLAKEGAEKG